ncbi:MAG: glucuronate isomerase [Vicinamibacteria bacterium]|nr:glucuronate isomerase [Vicinamibacteria bacterium]
MKQFLTDDFLLETDTARVLYHDHAKSMPIFDYHCHLPPRNVAENAGFENLTQIWLYGDHYKWRAMRANGVAERLCTGDASDWEKYEAWAATMPYTIGNPLYHWSHLELKNYFGIKGKVLNPESAREIWDACNAQLQTDRMRVHGIMADQNVRVVCTTDDPTDDLEHHRAMRGMPTLKTRVLPAFRPDKAMAVETGKAFVEYIEKLGQVAGSAIRSFEDLREALDKRHQFFHAEGSRISDHGLIAPVHEEATDSQLDAIFKKALSGGGVTETEGNQFKTALLLHFGRMNARRGWTMQLHMGAIRNNSTRMLRRLGPDTGYDSIGDCEIAAPLSRLLDALDVTNELPRTILYVLNPRDNELIATMIGNFQDGSTPGKIQFGSGWWFNDQKDGMIRQMSALALLGLLSRFVGMTTDSRSFLSYPRHEYFRRILCNMVGTWVEQGEAPRDMGLLGNMIQDICFRNAERYFGISADPGAVAGDKR